MPTRRSEQSDAGALYAQADALFDRGVPERAIPLLRRGAALGDASAADRLGCAYADGEGVRRSFALAERWLRVARKRGSSIAAANLAVVYADQGRWRDAARFWRIALREGDLGCALDLAMCHLEGLGVQRDPRKAHELLQRAARGRPRLDITQYEQETVMALLGVLCARGLGVEADRAAARRWLRRASKDGDYEQASRALTELDDVAPKDVVRGHPWDAGTRN